MGRTKANDLKDLIAELAALRELPGLREKSPGIFYFKCLPFLHFHDQDGERWADIKVDGHWQKTEIGFTATAAERAKFLRAAKAAHAALAKG